MKSKLLLAVIAGMFASGAAIAQSSPAVAPAPDAAVKKQNNFAGIDKDGDRAISREEAAGKKRLSKNFDQIDANKDGKLAKDEMKAHSAEKRAKHGARFDGKFTAADSNKDGALTKAEVDAANMSGLSKHFDQLDANKDGKVSKEEMQARHDARRAKHGMKKANFDSKFKAADKDGDGALSKVEADGSGMRRVAKNFERIDVNKDGKATMGEMQAVNAKNRQ